MELDFFFLEGGGANYVLPPGARQPHYATGVKQSEAVVHISEKQTKQDYIHQGPKVRGSEAEAQRK